MKEILFFKKQINMGYIENSENVLAERPTAHCRQAYIEVKLVFICLIKGLKFKGSQTI